MQLKECMDNLLSAEAYVGQEFIKDCELKLG